MSTKTAVDDGAKDDADTDAGSKSLISLLPRHTVATDLLFGLLMKLIGTMR